MRFFTNGISLKMMNQVIAKQIPNHSLIGDLPLSRKDFNYLASKIKELNKNKSNSWIDNKYRECLAVFLVFCAVYEYEHRTFWNSIEKYTGHLSYQRRVEFDSFFLEVLEKYNLNTFEDESEEGYKYVTPILCHAGIPTHAFDSYFSAISNTVNDTFYDDFDVDDYLAYMKNKTEMPVKRYIKLTDNREAYNFIQNTKKLILSDSVDSDEEMDSGNYIRMLEQINLWKENPDNKKSLQARSNVQITAPKIKIDLDGIGIYCEMPRIVVKDCYDSYISWEITSDENTHFVKADFFRRSGVLVSEEKIITLRPAFNYTITLKVDDQQISKWEFKGIRDNYISFFQNGNIIKSEFLPNSPVILLLNKDISIFEKDDLSIMEYPQVPLWDAYNVYRVDLSNLKELQCTGFNIRVNSENKPIIAGGKKLFDQENTKAYIVLPFVKVPVINKGQWHIEIKHKAGSVVISKSNIVLASDCERISLSEYINKECYGDYYIKIWNNSGINGRFNIEYVPFGVVQVDKSNYWPSNQGYLSNIQLIHTSKKVDLEIYNAEKVLVINHDDDTVYRYKLSDKDRFLIGEYRYTSKGYDFSTSFKKSIYPVFWGIIGLEDEIMNLSNRVYTLTLSDLSNAIDPYLLFAFNFEENDDVQNLRVDLIGVNKAIAESKNISIKNRGGLRVPLNSFLYEVQNTSTEIDYRICVTLFDSNDIQVSSFVAARFQDEIIVENVQLSRNKNEICITWDEIGSCYGREIVLFNFLKPWLSPYHYNIKDKVCETTINTELLEEGIYGFLIQKEPNDLFLDEYEADICSLRDFQKMKIVVKGEREYSSDMERILYQLLRSRFIKKELVQKKLMRIKSEIKSIKIRIPEDINFLANAYVMHDRFFLEKEDACEIVKLFTALFDMLRSKGNEVIKYILESNFSKEYKKELLHKFYCNNLTSTTRLNELQLKLLTEIDEDMAGFVNLIQFDNKLIGLNWAGISDIEVLKGKNLFGESNKESMFLSDENLGKSSYIIDYFQYVYNCLQRPKNISKSSVDFLREFNKEKRVQETLIFGKTRLQLLVEWKDHNNEVKQIQERLADILYIPCENAVKEQFKDAFYCISKRRVNDELGYYIGLTALYASFMRNGLMEESREFSHLLNYTIEKCGKLYFRDAIVIELYMHLERRYSWV